MKDKEHVVPFASDRICSAEAMAAERIGAGVPGLNFRYSSDQAMQ